MAEFDPGIPEIVNVYTFAEVLDRVDDKAAELGLRSMAAVATLLVSRYMRGEIDPVSGSSAWVQTREKRKTSVRIPQDSWYDATGYLPEEVKSARFRATTVRNLLLAFASGELTLHIDIR